MASDENDTGQKTEQPTAKRLGEARKDGNIAKSTDLSQVMGLIAAFLALKMIAPSIWDDVILLTKGGLSGSHSTEPFTIETLHSQFAGLIGLILPEILLLTVIAGFVGGGATAIQTKFLWSKKLLKPKFSNINPVSGFKRLFSLQNFITLLKAIAKLCIIGPIAYFAFFDIFPEIMTLMQMPIIEFLPFASRASSLIFWRIISLLFILAILDYVWQSYRTNKDLKMTKVEIKEERKAIEGDEKTKQMIRSKALTRVRERMIEAVQTADVVVTNPTHLAVALKYNLSEGTSPKVVAKGRGHLAERIRTIATQHDVPVIERKPLARALFKTVEVGQDIPYELFAAVAEILAYVYRLRGKNPFGSTSGKKTSE